MPRSVCSSCTFLSPPCQSCHGDKATVPKPGSSPGLSVLLGSLPSWGGKWGTLHSPLTPQLLPGLCILIFFGVNKPVLSTSHFLFCHSRVKQRVGKSSPPAPPFLSLTQDTQSQWLSTAKHPWHHRVSLSVPSPWSRAQQGGWWQQGGGQSPLGCSQLESPVSPGKQPPGLGYQCWVNTALLIEPAATPTPHPPLINH